MGPTYVSSLTTIPARLQCRPLEVPPRDVGRRSSLLAISATCSPRSWPVSRCLMGDNTRISQLSALLPPSLAFQEVPGDMPTYHQVVETRQQVLDILSGADDRLVVVLGPPADSEPAALTELATQLQALKPKLEKELLLIVLADAALQPEGTEAVQINRGLRQARELLLQISRLGLPVACEFADTITPQFFADLLSWSCVSAGSETLRELVSGLSMPAGLRAHFDDTSAAVRATSTTGTGHSFLGVSGEGVCGIVQTAGNPDVHALLRASSYHVKTAAEAKAALEAACARVDAERAGAPIVLDGCGLDGPALKRLAEAVVLRIGRAGEETPRPFDKGGVCGLSACPSSTKEVGPLLASLAAAVAGRRKSTKQAYKRAAAATSEETNNLRIVGVRPLLPPACLLEELPREAAHEEVVRKGREELLGVLRGTSPRVALIVGQPAVDDAQACLEFAARLATLAAEVKEEVLVLARVPFTRHASSGWAGIVKDPDGDGSMQINRGLRQARELLLQISRLGLPVACEFADTITPQFFADLLSWSCVSAGSETLRELVSGLSMPAGLRAHVDATSAERMAAVAASLADAAGPQVFFGVTSHGIAGIVQSKGNDECALVMHGGAGTPEERAQRIVGACTELRKAAPAAPAAPPVIVECGGAEVTPDAQAQFVAKLAEAHGAGDLQLQGLSLSSHLLSGSQAADAPNRVRGLSITEPCLDWAATSEAVHAVAAAVRRRNAATAGAATKKPRRG